MMRQVRHRVTRVSPVTDLADGAQRLRLRAVTVDGWYDDVGRRGLEPTGELQALFVAEVRRDSDPVSGVRGSWEVSGRAKTPSGGDYRIVYADPTTTITVQCSSIHGAVGKLRAPVLGQFPGPQEQQREYRRAIEEFLARIRVVGRKYHSTALAATITAEPLRPSARRVVSVFLLRWKRGLGGLIPYRGSPSIEGERAADPPTSADVGDGDTESIPEQPRVGDFERIRIGLHATLDDSDDALSAAEQLCAACVELLGVGGAALSAAVDGVPSHTLGASSHLSRELEEMQFTFGEGPCLDAVHEGPLVAVALASPSATRWPAFTRAAWERGVRMVLALPVTVANTAIGSLALYCFEEREVDNDIVKGALMAAELATMPLLDLLALGPEVSQATSASTWDLSAHSRVEVYQAAGMLTIQLGIGPADALARLRAYAFAHDLTASAVAWEIVERRLRLDDDRSGGKENRLENPLD